jgi:hypothetical protein
MKFELFLKESLENSFWQKGWSTLIFRGKGYQGRFFKIWRDAVERSLGTKTLLLEHDGKNLPPELSIQTIFNSEKSVYWLGELSSKASRFFTYSGSKKIICFVPSTIRSLKSNKECIVVDIEEVEDVSMVGLLAKLKQVELSQIKLEIIKKVLSGGRKLSLDNVLGMFDYLELSGKSSYKLLPEFLDSLFGDESNLFALTDLFFEKKTKKFYELWDKVESKFAPQFWVAFWSRQLFKAASFVQVAASNPIEAKALSRGLSWKFVRDGWKSYPLKSLSTRICNIYELDMALKSGSEAMKFESFFSKHFCTPFATH